MKLNTLEDLFVCLLSDIYVVESQIVEDMPLLINKVHSQDLKNALKHHLSETKEQVKRLDKIFQIIRQKPAASNWCGDIFKLFSDTAAFLKENAASPVLDAAVIAIAQRIEHFEITTYGTLRELADVLNYDEVKSLLKETIKEEGHADKLLTKLAEGGIFSEGINVKATR